jgi:hypothetical protein
MAKVTINTSRFKRFISNFTDDLDRAIPKALNRSGEKTRETILDRTSRGVGLRGRFKRYSKGYAEFRKENGRGTTPDLNFSGRMLSNLDVERKGRNRVIVGFKRKQEQEKAKFNQKTRPFIGVTSGEVKFIADAFERQLQRELR